MQEKNTSKATKHDSIHITYHSSS